ncbi:MAG: prepilin-type N-terminal cleavage/methylation domain-containing protein [Clostridia bacterium]|nr:prepilin-type N-terminal cleavage/methylation domain-containing protein [Clostridia bacterium]
MNKMKNEKGITLASVIIAIILMSILIGVTTYSGINSYRNTKIKQFIYQMQLIQGKVDEIVNAKEDTSQLGEASTQWSEGNAAKYSAVISSAVTESGVDSTVANYKYFSEENLKNQLDLENIDTDVLINFTTREVVSINGIEYNGKTYYTQYSLEEGQKLIDYQSEQKTLDWNVSKEIDGLNCLVRITDVYSNAKLVYGELEGETENKQVSTWNTLSNYTKENEEYTVNISKSGDYVFRIINNETNNYEEQTVNIDVTNRPKTNNQIENYDYSKNNSEMDSTKWAYTTVIDEEENENLYVWVPRFVINNDTDEIKFIKGNSNIATDNTYITIGNGENDWSIPNIFTNNNEELTGIWIKVNTNENLSLIDLVNEENIDTLNEI